MKIDTSGAIRPKTVEDAVVAATAYLLNNPPEPNDPRVAMNRATIEGLSIFAAALALGGH